MWLRLSFGVRPQHNLSQVESYMPHLRGSPRHVTLAAAVGACVVAAPANAPQAVRVGEWSRTPGQGLSVSVAPRERSLAGIQVSFAERASTTLNPFGKTPQAARRRRILRGAAVGAVVGLGATVLLRAAQSECCSYAWYRDRSFYDTTAVLVGGGALAGAAFGAVIR